MSPALQRSPLRGGRAAVRAAAAVVLAVTFAAGCAPRPRVPPGVDPPPGSFVRLPYLQAVHGDSAVVRWRVREGTGTALEYRPAGGEEWREAPGRDLGLGDRRVVLAGLQPGERLEYRVRAGGVTAGPFGVRAAPADTATEPVRVLAFGDSGWGSPEQVALARLMSDARRGSPHGWDLAVHVGDVSYPDGTERDLTLRHFSVYDEIFPGVPFFPVPGNHDVKAADGAAYDRAFDWPGDGEDRWYTFRWGRVQFLGLDTSTGARKDSLSARTGAQYRWLVSTLDSVSRDTTLRWTVVFTHHPLYSHRMGFLGHGPAEEVREAIEPLLLEYGVDLVLAGHDHHYERTVPLRQGAPVPPGCGPVHMVIGGGGAARMFRSIRPGRQTARIDRAYHFLDLRVRPAVMIGRAVDPEGGVFDQFRIRPYQPEEEEDGCD